MNDCERYIPMISALADGELDIAEKADLRSHLARCEDCAALYRFYSEVSLALEEDMAEPPAALRQNIMDAVAKKRVKKRRSGRRYAGYLAAAACFVLIVAVAPRLSGLGCGRSGGTVPAAPMAAESSAPAYDSSAAAPAPSAAIMNGTAGDRGESREEYGAKTEEYDIYAAGTEEVMEEPAEAEMPMMDEPTAAADDGDEAVPSYAPMESENAASAAEADRSDELLVYYSVVTVRGALPELLKNAVFSEKDYGTVCEISPSSAEELKSLGYTVEYVNADSEVSLVIWDK